MLEKGTMAASVERPSNLPHIRGLLSFGALLLVLAASIIFSQIMHARSVAIRDGQQQSIRLSHILADHVELTFLGVDLSLRRAIERQYFNTLFGNNLPEYTEQNFKVWLNETPQIVALALINERGVVEVAGHKKGYDHWLDYQKTMSDQTFFDYMREAGDTDVFIGKYYTQDKGSLIVMSRRYNKINGEFGGIVVAAINPQYVIDFYNSIASGEQKLMSVMLSDGSVLVSGPSDDPANVAALSKWVIAQDPSKNTEQSDVQSEPDLGVLSFKELRNMSIIVAVALYGDDVLADWRQQRNKDLGFFALFVVFGSILLFFAVAMARQIAKVEESEAAAILASQAKSEFLATMSHELRTPLNAIIGFSEMINSGYFGPLNTKQKERIHDINLCGGHLLQLITDILEFSKGDAGKLELSEEKVEIAEIVSEGVRIMNGKLRTKNIHLIVAVDPDLPPLRADKRKLRQIIINLLSNAIKFTPENGTITITGRLDLHGDMNITVADTGIGIAEDDIPKALSVFGQVHRSKSHEGTGLGLPLCKMYAELHDGKLILTSTLGEGTSVRVFFPRERVLSHKEI